MYDVVIVGGGPAGLSAALVLGRCCRKVLVCDDGHARNAVSRHAHGFFTRDGTPPGELRAIGRHQAAKYGVELRDVRVEEAERVPPTGFLVTLQGGETIATRKLLLATGIVDEVPDRPGFREFYGDSVFVCPYCDAWEHRDQPLAAFGHGKGTIEMALGLTTWSPDVALFTDGDRVDDAHDRERLALHGVALFTERVRALEGEHGRLRRVRLEDGAAIPRAALFFHLRARQRSPLAERLGCELDDKGFVIQGPNEEAGVPDLWVAGDASEDVHSIAVAVAEGYRAACNINQTLRAERTSQVTLVGVDVIGH